MQQRWLCGNCHSLNDAEWRHCYACRTDRAAGETFDPRGSPEGPGLAAAPHAPPNVLTATGFGLAAGLVALVLWYWWEGTMGGTGQLYGRGVAYVGEIVGIAIGAGVVLGARGRTSFTMVLISVALTVGALVIGEYLLMSRWLGSWLGSQLNGGFGRAPTLDPGELIIWLPTWLALAPLRPVTWIVALAVAFFLPWSRLVGRAPVRRPD
jgi:hypothetical protein